MGASEYVNEYASSLPEVAEFYLREGTTGRLRCRAIDEATSSIKVGLLYRDTTIFDLGAIDFGEGKMSWLTPSAFEEHGVGPAITINAPDTTDPQVFEDIRAGRVGFAFLSPSGDAVDQFLSDAAPLIASGALLPLPKRLLFHTDGESKAPKGGRMWHALEAAASSSLDVWSLSSEGYAESEPTYTDKAFVASFGESDLEKVIVNLSLPFIDNISLSDYFLIMQDEKDIVVEFRVAMMQLAKMAKEHASIAEFSADVISPRLAKIDRSFRRISSQYRMKTAGAVIASTALTLGAFASAGAVAAISAAAGGAGFITAVKELADGAEKQRALKDDPLYLLWRLQRARS